MNKGFDKETFKRSVVDNVKNMFLSLIHISPELLYQQRLPGAGNHGYPGAYGAVHSGKAEGGMQGPRRRLCRCYHGSAAQ